MKVFVYYNLHKHVWSVKSLEGPMKGKVMLHSGHVTLHNPVFKVSEAGRQRVLREKQKNVHAGVEGHLLSGKAIDAISMAEFLHIRERGIEVTYNPYKYKTFVDKATELPVESGSVAIFMERQVFLR